MKSTVKILVFIPHLELKNTFEEIFANFEKPDYVQIEMTYVFGTPHALSQNWDADILVARGMTYRILKEVFPNKHVVQIPLNSFDMLDALMECKRKNVRQIALCLPNFDPRRIPLLESFCEAKIRVYDVWDESSCANAVASAQRDGCDIYVGAGTMCGICDRLALPHVHIHTKQDSLLVALDEAMKAAKTINLERTRSGIIDTMLNHSEEGIIALSDEGRILAINNQAHRMLQLTTMNTMEGQLAETLVPSDSWRAFFHDQKKEKEQVLQIYGNNYYVHFKPLNDDEQAAGSLIFIRNANQIIKEESRIRLRLAEKGLVAKYSFKDIIGSSNAIRENIRMAERYSKVNSNVLIVGETGTGKELFAHSIHQASNRSAQPFVALNCAALPENLLESELFGYEEGAFSGAVKGGKIGLFEQAHKGTIFLDEIGELPSSLQAKLLRVIQEKEIRRIGSTSVHPVDVRIISATNVNIEEKIRSGEFRSDLYFRLNLLDLTIPPLRERREDIQDLVDFYLSKFSCEMAKSIPTVTPEASQILRAYDWPGNVRELRNVCERLVVLNDTNQITKEILLDIKPFSALQEPRVQSQFRETASDADILASYLPRRKKKDIARELGVSRTTLWRMEKKRKH